MKILGCDPGPLESAYCLLQDGLPPKFGCLLNQDLRAMLMLSNEGTFDQIGIEMVASYGMAVGREVFETVLAIGRFCERSPIEPVLVYRKDVKMHFCQSMRAKDANIRQAILDRFGGKEKGIGRKASKGALYGVSGHVWSALAVALYIQDKYIFKIKTEIKGATE